MMGPANGSMLPSHSAASLSGMMTGVNSYRPIPYMPPGPAGHPFHVQQQQMQPMSPHTAFMGVPPLPVTVEPRLLDW